MRILTLCVLALPAGRAATQTTYSWIATSSGNFSTAANWINPPGAPVTSATSTIVFFNSGATAYTATQDIAATLQANALAFDSNSTALTTIAGTNSLLLANVNQNDTGAASVTAPVALATLGGGGTGAVAFSGAVSFTNNSLALNGLNTTTFSGAAGSLAFASGLTITGNGVGNALFTTAITTNASSFAINTTGQDFSSGVVQLSGANTFTSAASIQLQSGTLALGGTSPLGAATNRLAVTGGALRVSTASTIANPVDLGVDLVVAGTLGLTLTGPIAPASGTPGLQVLGSGTVTIQNAATLTGRTVVGATGLTTTTLTLSSTATTNGTLLSTSSITVNANATVPAVLALTNTTAVADRVGAAPLFLNSGRIVYTAGAGAYAQTFGPLTINGFGGVGAVVAGTTTATALTFGNLSLPNNATLGVRGPIVGAGGSATNALLSFANGASLVGLAPAGSGAFPILPFAVGSTAGNGTAVGNLVGKEGAGARVLLDVDLTAVLAGAALPADQNALVNPGSPQALAAGTTTQVNAIAVTFNSTSGTINFAGGTGSTLRVFSGAVVTANTTVFSVPTLDFGPRAGYFAIGSNTTVNSTITGSAGVVVTGYNSTGTPNPFILNAVNSFTGGLTLNGTMGVQFSADAQLGAAGGAITLGGSSLRYTGAAPLTISRPFVVTQAGGFIDTGAANTPLVTLDVTNITGSGPLGKTGPGTLQLSGGTTGAWGFIATSGVTVFGSDTSFGSGPITLNGGTVQPFSDIPFSRNLRINAASTIDVGSNISLFSGTLTSLGYTAAIGASPGLTKAGTGTLRLSAASPNFAGPITVAAGGLTVSGSLPRAASFTVAGGATLTLPLSGSQDRINGAVVLQGGELAFTSTTSPALETIGAVSSTAPGGVVTLAPASGAMQVAGAYLSIGASGTLLVRGTNLGTAGAAQLFFTSAPPTVNGVIPGVVGDTSATGGGSTLVGYSTTTGVTPATLAAASSTLQNAAPTNTPTTANFLTAATTTTQDAANTVNSLTLASGSTLTTGSPATSTLTVTTGAVVAPGGTSSIAAGLTLSAPANVGFLFAASNTLVVNGPITGGNGNLVKYGVGQLNLLAANTFAGTINASAGNLNLAADTSAASITGIGGVTVNSGATLLLTGTGAATFNGGLFGTGGLLKTSTSTGTQILAGVVSLAGPIQSSAGTLSIRQSIMTSGNSIVVGDAATTATATLELAPGVTVGRPTTFAATMATFFARTLQSSSNAPGQAAIAFSAPVTLNSGLNISSATPNAIYTFINPVGGVGGIAVNGGTVNLTGGNPSLAGDVTLSSNSNPSVSTLGLGTNGSLGSGGLALGTNGGFVVAIGGARTLTNNITANVAAPLYLGGTNNLTFTGVFNVLSTGATLDNRSTNGSVLTVNGATDFGGTATLTINSATATPAGNVVRLTGTNGVGGPVTVAGGVLNVAGTLTATAGDLVVQNGAKLMGTGTINRQLNLVGTVAPGNSVGQLNLGSNATFQPGSRYEFEYNAIAGLTPGVTNDFISGGASTTFDFTNVTTTAPVTIVIQPIAGTPMSASPVTYSIASFAGVNGFDPLSDQGKFAFAGTFAGTPTVGVAGGTVLTLTFTPVPEPGCLLLVAGLGLACRSRRLFRRREGVPAAEETGTNRNKPEQTQP